MAGRRSPQRLVGKHSACRTDVLPSRALECTVNDSCVIRGLGFFVEPNWPKLTGVHSRKDAFTRKTLGLSVGWRPVRRVRELRDISRDGELA